MTLLEISTLVIEAYNAAKWDSCLYNELRIDQRASIGPDDRRALRRFHFSLCRAQKYHTVRSTTNYG